MTQLDRRMIDDYVTQWKRYRINRTYFTGAVNTQTKNFISIPAGWYITQFFWKTSTAWTGGTTSAITLDSGILNTSEFLSGYDLKAAVSGSNYMLIGNPTLSFSSSQQMTVTLTTTGDTINHITAGAVDIYIEVMSLNALTVFTQTF